MARDIDRATMIMSKLSQDEVDALMKVLKRVRPHGESKAYYDNSALTNQWSLMAMIRKVVEGEARAGQENPDHALKEKILTAIQLAVKEERLRSGGRGPTV